MSSREIDITRFAQGRHFDPEFAGTRVVGLTPEQLVELANEALAAGAELVDGYAPFCKHLFLVNESDTLAGIAPITDENRHALRTDYVARREGELPVMVRWLEGVEAPRATHLDLVLYTREALEAEAKKFPEGEPDVPDANWGIVSVNAELQAAESPMPPITMMRNALGREEGGSGQPLDRDAYARSVEFWRTHATVK
ncbi:DUF3228 family protein [Candidatus Nomurabacteria bacterium]|nr:DUF3228 family protein [Candidatus Nomurabacteria bacterium]